MTAAVRELQEEVRELRNAVVELRSEAGEYRAETEQLRRELQASRSSARYQMRLPRVRPVRLSPIPLTQRRRKTSWKTAWRRWKNPRSC